MFFYQDLSNQSKRFVQGLALLLLVGLVLSAFAFAFSYFVSAWHKADGQDYPNAITVSGEGKATVKPDLGIFTVSVITNAKKVKDAQSQNTEHSNAILKYLKDQGVADKDLKTISYGINPQYQYYNVPPCYSGSLCPVQKPPEIVSYEVRHTLEVKVRDLSKIDDLLSGVVASGANEVGTISFTVDKIEDIKAEARKAAIEDAKNKAKILSNDLGIRLKKIIGYGEPSGDMPIYSRTMDAYSKGGNGEVVATPTPQIASGEQEIKIFVSVTYELR